MKKKSQFAFGKLNNENRVVILIDEAASESFLMQAGYLTIKRNVTNWMIEKLI